MKEKLTRRELLFGRHPGEGLKRDRNVVTISKPEGTYTVAYGVHIISQDPADIVDGTDALFLESGVGNWTKDPLNYLYELKSDLQYKDLLPKLEEKRIPVVFSDVGAGFVPVIMDSILVPTGEAYLGLNLLVNQRSKHLERRRFIEGMLGMYLLVPLLSQIYTSTSIIFPFDLNNSNAEFQKLSHKLHPEFGLYAVKLRNAMIAYKQEALMKYLGTKPHFTTIFGMGHTEIEDEIKASLEGKYEFIKRCSFDLRKILIEPEAFYKMAECRFNGNSWELTNMYEFPELKALIS